MNLWQRILACGPNGAEPFASLALDAALADARREGLNDADPLAGAAPGEVYRRARGLPITVGHVQAWRGAKGRSVCGGLALASFNRDGRVREAALRALGEHAHRAAVGCCVWGLRDWVPQVRAAAAASLRTLMRPELVEAFVLRHRVIEQVGQSPRRDPEAWAELHAFLASDEAKPVLRRAAVSADAAAARFALDRLHAEVAAEPDLRLAVGGHRDPQVRLWLAEYLHLLPDEARRRWSAELMLDRAPRVADTVLRTLPAALRLALTESIEEACGAEAASTRHLARCRAQRLGATPPAELARTRVAAVAADPDAAAPGWLLALGETGSAADAIRLRPWLDHRSPRLRAAALQALARLIRPHASACLMDALIDPSRRVRKVAIAELACPIDTDEVEGVRVALRRACEAGDLKALKAAATILGRRGQAWDTALACLRLATYPAADPKAHAASRADAWLRHHQVRGWIHPDQTQRPHLGDALQALEAPDATPTQAGRPGPIAVLAAHVRRELG